MESGDTTTLSADNKVQLLAAANTATQTSDQKSSSGSVGVTLGKNTGVTVSAAQGSGDGNGQDLSYTNTQIGGKIVNLQSGGDTTLQGAVVKANTANATVGGNLNIQSLQSSSRYKESSQNASGSITIGAGAGGSVSAGATNINSNYLSVTEQSGIRAGDGGYNVNVQGNTDLQGGAITSTQKAIDDNKNSFTTAKLTTSDLQNSASYSAESYQVSVGTSGGSAGAGQDSGQASSTTKAAISGIAGNKAARTGDAETGIKKIFDQAAVTKDINAQVQITQEFGQRASQAVGDYAGKKYAEALKNNDKEGMDRWKEGGASRVALHALVGGLGGGVGGAAGAATSQATIPMIGEEIAKLDLPVELKSALVQAAGIAIGVATGGTAGAVASQNATANNYLTAADLRNKGQKLKDCRSAGNAQCEINVLKEYELKNARNTGGINYKSVLTESSLQAEKTALERFLKDPDISPEAKAEARRSIRELEVAINVIQRSPVVQNALEVSGIALDVATLGELAGVRALTSKLVTEIIARRTGQTVSAEFAESVATSLGRQGASGGNGNAIFVDAAGGTKNPLLADAMPRNGDRLVLNQGNVPTCGANSCGMTLDTMGRPVDVATLVQMIPPTERGILPSQVASLMKSQGVDATAFGGRNVTDLARYTENGTPVLVRIADPGVSDFSHFVVIDGVTTRNGVQVVAIRDPQGAQYFSPVATFNKSFTGEVIVPKPVPTPMPPRK